MKNVKISFTCDICEKISDESWRDALPNGWTNADLRFYQDLDRVRDYSQTFTLCATCSPIGKSMNIRNNMEPDLFKKIWNEISAYWNAK